MEYINIFYNKNYQGSRQTYNTGGCRVETYKGHLIVEHTQQVFHVVRGAVCVGMYAGKNGAKQFIDNKILKSCLSAQ